MNVFVPKKRIVKVQARTGDNGMFFHSRNGNAFVGLRLKRGGGRQVVFDAVSGERVVLDVSATSATDEAIEAALREGIESRNALGGIIAALQERNIRVETANNSAGDAY